MNHRVRTDLIGKRFGRFVVLEFSHINKYRNTEWKVRCDCGSELVQSRSSLTSGHTKSCGCLSLEGNAKKLAKIAEGRRAAARLRLASGLKKCAKPDCKEANPQPLESFAYSGKHADRKQPWCKGCYANNSQRHRRLNLSPEARDLLVSGQGNACASCGESFNNRRYHVDHDHSTGVIRGVLCAQCNMALGLLGDSPERISRLLDYTTKHRQLKLLKGGKG